MILMICTEMVAHYGAKACQTACGGASCAHRNSVYIHISGIYPAAIYHSEHKIEVRRHRHGGVENAEPAETFPAAIEGWMCGHEAQQHYPPREESGTVTPHGTEGFSPADIMQIGMNGVGVRVESIYQRAEYMRRREVIVAVQKTYNRPGSNAYTLVHAKIDAVVVPAYYMEHLASLIKRPQLLHFLQRAVGGAAVYDDVL